MRVALLCPYSLSIPGGVQGQVLGIARELTKLGHDSTVLAPVDDVLPAGAGDVISLGRSIPVRANGSVAPVALGPKASERAIRALRTGSFDVLHLHEPLAPGASYACLLRGSRGQLALVGTFHRSGPSALYKWLAPITRSLANRLQVRCAVSEEAIDTARDALGGNYELVGNGVDVERFRNAEPWPTGGPTVMFLGRHEKRKGLEWFLDAFNAQRNEHATCWVAGAGPDTARLKEKYPPSETLQWLGRIDDIEVARRLRGSDVACFPSLGGESFGVVLLEAMAAGCATVASDIPGYRSVAEGYAELVSPGDVESLTRKLEVAFSDAESGTGFSSPERLAAASLHASSWSMGSIAERYVSIYRQAIGSLRNK